MGSRSIMLCRICLTALLTPYFIRLVCGAAQSGVPARGVNALPSDQSPSQAQVERQERDLEDFLFHKFVTRPDIGAPRWEIQVHDKDAISPGYFFVAPYAHLDQKTFPKWNGPHIYDSDGDLVWSGAPMFNHWNAFDFRAVHVEGKQMLSLIDPHQNNAEGIILDNNYEIYSAMNLRGDLWDTNMHDFVVVDEGENALTLSIVPGDATREQSKVVGFDGECRASWEGFKELRVNDSEVLFEWTGQGHIGLDECTFVPEAPEEICKSRWDILHLNSIDKFPDGDYLVSSRHTDAVYKISHEDGHVVWRLGGTKSDFRLDGESRFSRQHNAVCHGQNETHTLISLLDNAHGDGPPQAEIPSNDISRGLLFALRTDTSPMTAELLEHYDHPRGGIANSRGSMQFLPNGNVFMGWTYASRQSEHAADGKLLMESFFRFGEAHSYRNYKFPWIGRPSQPPDVHSVGVDEHENVPVTTMIYVSWNGATDVKSWQMYKCTADGKVTQLIGSTLRQGFETVFNFNGYAAFVILEALDENGLPIERGRSEVIRTTPPINMDSPEVMAELQWLQSRSNPGLRQKLRAIFSDPPLVFFLGFACAIFPCFALFWFARRARASWWRRISPISSPLNRWRRSSGHRGRRRSAIGLEADRDDEDFAEDEEDEVSRPLVRKNKEEGFVT